MTDFFIADTHFGHKNILKFCSETRPFNDIESHDQALIDNWNSVVTDNDRVFILGDFYLGGHSNRYKNVESILNSLNGKKILVQGNHDLAYNVETLKILGFEKVVPMYEYKGCLLTHIPIDPGEIRGQSKRGRYLANIHGHLHDEGNTQELVETGRFCVSAEMFDLTPISWDSLWMYISVVGGRYKPIRHADKVSCVLEYKTEIGLFTREGRRIKGSTVTIEPKRVYNLQLDGFTTEGFITLTMEEDPGMLYTVKSKNFVGIA